MSTNPAGTESRKPLRRPLKDRRVNEIDDSGVDFNKESTEEATGTWESVAKTSKSFSQMSSSVDNVLKLVSNYHKSTDVTHNCRFSALKVLRLASENMYCLFHKERE